MARLLTALSQLLVVGLTRLILVTTSPVRNTNGYGSRLVVSVHRWADKARFEVYDFDKRKVP